MEHVVRVIVEPVIAPSALMPKAPVPWSAPVPEPGVSNAMMVALRF